MYGNLPVHIKQITFLQPQLFSSSSNIASVVLDS